jgi:D-alanyl-D-alanine carboxypeptidase
MIMTEFKKTIEALYKSLGIPKTYENEYSLILHEEAQTLTAIENDIFNRPQQLTPEAAAAWRDMKAQAQKDGIVLSVVSAFRSVAKQADIIQRKINAGQSVRDILNVSAAPGYSEHHTGRAIDITTHDCEPLSESFDATAAFQWLQKNVHDYSFTLSYPKDNTQGIAYEPWHWAYHPAP